MPRDPVCSMEVDIREARQRFSYMGKTYLFYLAAPWGTRQSQNLIVDGELVYRGMPEISELTRYLDQLKSSGQQSS
ncbi:MAG: hypothetical protein K9K62_03635 [Desulfobacteraceae bacterium]|nr:hypothetical protein [Desulfobacteraceae bacterium]